MTDVDPLLGFLHETSLVEAELLLASFVLCSLLGLERQLRQKSAGYRTHVLVGMGSCAFTLVSAYGFATVLADDVMLDPSRIAAQVVTGIGFLGAGVIFKGRTMVRGLTTAATVWVSAAVGMACGAGMLSLAVMLTVLTLVTLFVVAPLIRRIPDADRRRLVRVTYRDGAGVLRDLLAVATTMGFAGQVVGSRRLTADDGAALVRMDIRFLGRRPVHQLVPELTDLPGVESVSLREDEAHGVDADGDSI